MILAPSYSIDNSGCRCQMYLWLPFLLSIYRHVCIDFYTKSALNRLTKSYYIGYYHGNRTERHRFGCPERRLPRALARTNMHVCSTLCNHHTATGIGGKRGPLTHAVTDSATITTATTIECWWWRMRASCTRSGMAVENQTCQPARTLCTYAFDFNFSGHERKCVRIYLHCTWVHTRRLRLRRGRLQTVKCRGVSVGRRMGAPASMNARNRMSFAQYDSTTNGV